MLFSDQPGFCGVCGKPGEYHYRGSPPQPVLCSQACYNEASWRYTLHVRGKAYYHRRRDDLQRLAVGDVVCRLLAGQVEMWIRVTELRWDRIVCGLWEFDPLTGAEIDDDLEWGPPPRQTGSVLAKRAASE